MGCQMKTAILGFFLFTVGFQASAKEFQEQAMCTSSNPTAAFPRISIQTEPGSPRRALLILSASDGWTQVYSGPVHSTSTSLEFREDTNVISAKFLKSTLRASISFNGDEYVCDERSFGS